MRFSILRTITTCIGMLASSHYALAQNPVGSPQRDELEIVFTAQETLSSNTQCPTFFVTLNVSGLSPQLGVVTGKGSHCASPDASGNIQIPTGEMTVATAEGNEIRITYRFVMTAARAQPVYHLWGTFEVTGGTGRYATATGRGIVHGLDRVNPEQREAGPSVVTARGVLTY